ncbi:single-stranded DNA-binding protein [Xanthomonas oryzae]|uniref:single-stranded DNA-binding protein n=1 Tax=Xanthomonas oryzae TaxID=347 RepID=UPI003DA106E9
MSRIDNKFFFLGNLGTDVETRTLSSGDPVATLNIGVDDSYKPKDGERVKRTAWFEGTIYSKGLVEVCQRLLQKGSLVAVEGVVRKRVWDSKDRKDGDGKPLKDSRIEFVVTSVKFLAGLKSTAGDAPAEASAPEGEGGPDYDRMLDEVPA